MYSVSTAHTTTIVLPNTPPSLSLSYLLSM